MISTISETKAYSMLATRKSPFLESINKVYKYATDFLPKINRIFINYTGHGISHSLNVVEYMFELSDSPNDLSDLELTVIIYVALLHDIGMVVNEDEITEIKSDNLDIVNRKYSLVLDKYQDEMLALQECIRPVHGYRSMNHIRKMNINYFLIPGYTNISFIDDVAKICAAHNENFEWIPNNLSFDKVKGSYHINSQYIALLLRIADYLDIDEERAPLYLYQYLSPKDYGDLEWNQHFVIENKNKIVINEKIGYKNIEFCGESSNPGIHRKLLKYFDALNGELQNAIEFSETFSGKKYLLTLKPNIHNKIRTKGFNFSDFKLSLDYKAVTNLLMGENIYGEKKHGLRELIQNSIDACKVMQEESIGKSGFVYVPYEAFISIILDQDRKQVIVFDNGRGMSLEILKKYFLNVGVSYYISDDYLFKGNKYAPIGNYGIGFLACFMLSDKVNVITKYYGESQANKIEFEKNSEYICLTCENLARQQGTEIILDYDKFFTIFRNDSNNIETFLKKNFLECKIPIRIITVNDGKSVTKKVDLQKFELVYPDGIVLDGYLDNIQVSLKCNYKGINFLEKFSDKSSESYIFQEIDDKVILEEELDNPLLLKNYIDDGVIEFLTIPIIPTSEEEDFQKAYDVLEDFDEALEKVNYETVNILANDTSLYNSDELIDSSYDCIVGNYTLKNFRQQMKHSYKVPTYISSEELKVIQGNGNKILEYREDVEFYGKGLFQYSDCTYIKNVLISDVRLKIPFLVEGIQLQGIIVNISNKNFVPNISRNNISEQQNKDLAYAIGKALHKWIYENGGFEDEERAVLKKFIDKWYQDDNYCMKVKL